MTVPNIIWTPEPLPAGASIIQTGPACDSCGSPDQHVAVMPGGIVVQAPMTRSTEPDPTTGFYIVQYHRRWCPQIATDAPTVACPCCGAAVVSYNLARGMCIAVPHPQFGTAHLVGTADEILSHPDARRTDAVVRHEPSLDRATLEPCGHVLRGGQAQRLLAEVTKAREVLRRAEAEKELAAAADLLVDAVGAGYDTVADAYQAAVYMRSPTAAGLRAALVLLTEKHRAGATAGG